MQKISLRNILEALEKQDNFVFLETKRATSDEYTSYIFADPLDIVCCDKESDIKPSLDSIEGFLKKGNFAAGYICYEAGYAFEDRLSRPIDDTEPLLWFGIYKNPSVFDHRKVIFTDSDTGGNYSLNNISPNVSVEEYKQAIRAIKAYIKAGETYQVNYTFKLKFSFSGSALDLYLMLRRNQSVSYAAFIKSGGQYIISLSPELFFRKDGRSIMVRPMKGTAPRGRYLDEDNRNKELLSLCPKNRSENIMIVDLLRNDLGRISKTETVTAKSLFDVETYESLLQMTSTVLGTVKKDIPLYELYKALFPSGSVTGAPKIRTMQIINELEKEPRRIYTGSIGFFHPEGKTVFNVAIRTVVIDTAQKKGEMGVGSGIVYDSNAYDEYMECKLKAEFIRNKRPDFKLIETILWQPQGAYALLDLHIERLSESAEYFNFIFSAKDIIRKLHKHSSCFDKDKSYRVRLLLDEHGQAEITAIALEPDNADRIITFSDKQTSSADVFLFHKTTNRILYDEEYKRYKNEGFYDIIFQNEKGQITEGAISNVFIKKKGIYYTPPIECGLLNGVYRRHLMRERPFAIQEKILYREDVESADEIILTNAIRGIVRAHLIMARQEAYAQG